jgi:Fic family protein
MDIRAFKDSPSGRLVHTKTGYWAYVPAPLPPPIDWSVRLVDRLSKADRALGELAGLGHLLPNPNLFFVPFIRREAVLSSRIEGTRASLSDLYAYEAFQLGMFEQTSDVREVHNYVRALEYGLSRLQELPLSLRLIREIHQRLMEGVRGEDMTPGEFRRSQNWIGGTGPSDAVFVPPPVAEMLDALDAFEKFLYAEPTHPPLLRLAMIHYQFEAIHPFLDGNGRMGRLLLTLLMCTWRLLPHPLLYLSAFFEKHRQTYYELLLAVSTRGAWDAWFEYFLQGIAEQALDAVARARRMLDLRERYRTQFQAETRSARLLQVVDLLFARPVINIGQISEALDVSFASAQNHVRRLEKTGVLRETTRQARNRLYVADEVLRGLETPYYENSAMKVRKEL